MKKIRNSILYIILWLLPKNLLSHGVGFLVSLHLPKWLSCKINMIFVKLFNIDIKEAEKPLSHYSSLQEFFIRKLKPGARAISLSSNVISPCDGMIKISDNIMGVTLIQVKGKNYNINTLFNDDNLAEKFINGSYATIYLSPKDYHRFHSPINGVIEKTYYIKGKLWPVNNWAVNNIKDLFCQNERTISLIKENNSGKYLAFIAVGATMVGKIKLNYVDYLKNQQEIIHPPTPINLGDELGKFMFGSTIILVFAPGLISHFNIKSPYYIKMGEELAKF